MRAMSHQELCQSWFCVREQEFLLHALAEDYLRPIHPLEIDVSKSRWQTVAMVNGNQLIFWSGFPWLPLDKNVASIPVSVGQPHV